LVGHHTVGLSWESYVIQQIKNVCREEFHYYFYRTQHGAEADLILVRGSEVEYCIEIKFTNAPKISKGFLQVIEDLQPKNNFVITPGSDQFPIRENIQVISLGEFLKLSNLQK